MTGGSAEEGSDFFELGQRVTTALAETWGSLMLACQNLSDEQWNMRTACPGWSVRDQLSHLIGIERTLDGDPTPQWLAMPGPHVKTPFAEGNERWIAERRGRPGHAVREEFAAVTARRLAALEALTPEQWAQVGPSIVGTVPQAESMRVRVFDSWVHEQDVRLALGRPGGIDGSAADIALDQVQRAMGFVVGKQAAAPEGTVVCFSLAGPAHQERQITIAVEGGRARPVPSVPMPTVTLCLSSLDFVRLGCGREMASVMEDSGRVVVQGDQVVGRKILEAMNFMF